MIKDDTEFLSKKQKICHHKTLILIKKKHKEEEGKAWKLINYLLKFFLFSF